MFVVAYKLNLNDYILIITFFHIYCKLHQRCKNHFIQTLLNIGKVKVESINAHAGTIALSQGLSIFTAQRYIPIAK